MQLGGKSRHCTAPGAMPTPGGTASPWPGLRTSHWSRPRARRARRKAFGSGLREVGTYALLLAPGHPPRSPSPPNNGSSVPAGSSALESHRIPLRSARRSRQPRCPRRERRGGGASPRTWRRWRHPAAPRAPAARWPRPRSAAPSPPAAGTRGARHSEREAPLSGTSAAPSPPLPSSASQHAPLMPLPAGAAGSRGRAAPRRASLLPSIPASATAPRAGADKGEGTNTWRAPVPLWGRRVPQPRRRWGAGPSRPPQGPRGKGGTGVGGTYSPALAAHLHAARPQPQPSLRGRRGAGSSGGAGHSQPAAPRSGGRRRARSVPGGFTIDTGQSARVSVCVRVCARAGGGASPGAPSRRGGSGGEALFTRRPNPAAPPPPPDARAGPCATPPTPRAGRWYSPARRAPSPRRWDAAEAGCAGGQSARGGGAGRGSPGHAAGPERWEPRGGDCGAAGPGSPLRCFLPKRRKDALSAGRSRRLGALPGLLNIFRRRHAKCRRAPGETSERSAALHAGPCSYATESWKVKHYQQPRGMILPEAPVYTVTDHNLSFRMCFPF